MNQTPALTVTEKEANVHEITFQQRKFIIVGTAHVSHESVALVERIIAENHPSSVAIELCKPRFEALRNPDRWKQMDIFKILKEGKAYVLLAQLMVASFQKRLGMEIGIKPGAEMLAAATAADAQHCQVTLADREVGITLKRVWGAMGFWTTVKVLSALVGGVFSDEKVDPAEIERLKQADALEEALKEFSERLPEVRTALIDERDFVLAYNIRNSPGETVVGVVGAGHVPGILRVFETVSDISPYLKVPKSGWISKAFNIGIPAVLLSLVAAGFYYGGTTTSLEVIYRWSLVTSISAAIGAAIVLAHPLSILAGAISAPITTILPLVASGHISGLVEAWIRKPTVSDLENLSTDVTTFKGFCTNRVTKVLLVFVSTSLVTALGVWVAFKFAFEALPK